jgi:hypothetical protein
MQVQVTLEQIEESGPHGALCDRWCIYHGEPPDVRWARMSVDAARWHGYFIDGSALTRENPFAAREPAACKALNASGLEAVTRAAEAAGGHRLVNPKVVGVDPWGIDVRSTLGVVRIPAPAPWRSPSEPLAWLGVAEAD